MSPFLFVLAMEGLNGKLKTTQTNRWIRGFDVKSLRLVIVKVWPFPIFNMLITLYFRFSVLHINWGKSFYPLKVNEIPDIISLANILGGNVGELPTVYLGMPLGSKSKSKGICVF